MSFDVLQDKILEKNNPTVAGLDARIEYVPLSLSTTAHSPKPYFSYLSSCFFSHPRASASEKACSYAYIVSASRSIRQRSP